MFRVATSRVAPLQLNSTRRSSITVTAPAVPEPTLSAGPAGDHGPWQLRNRRASAAQPLHHRVPNMKPPDHSSRRVFVRNVGLAAGAIGVGHLPTLGAAQPAARPTPDEVLRRLVE